MNDKYTSAKLVCDISSKEIRSNIKRLRKGIVLHLLKHEHLEDGSILIFPFEAGLLNEVEKLVELEKWCCAFLSHKVERVDNKIIWTIRSEGAGVSIAQNYLSEQVEKKRWRLSAGYKAAALLTVCGFACTAPLVLGAMGLGITGFGISKLGAEISVFGIVVIVVGAYWYYKKRKVHMLKGTKNENRCGC